MATASLASVKARLSAFVDEVESTHERVVITRNGSPAAVLVAPDDLESLEETVAVLSDPETMRELAEAREAISRGDLTPMGRVALRSPNADVSGTAYPSRASST